MDFDFTGKWENQIKATMSITTTDGVHLAGTFTNALGKVGELTGLVNQGTIAFAVRFEDSTGSMLGQPLDLNDPDPSRFAAWWHFRLLGDTSPGWATVRTGCDTFTRVE
jgi:hypothetical protein